MAASMQQQFASKQMIKSVVLTNVVKAGCCTLLFALPLTSSSSFSLIFNVVTAVKVNIFCIFLLECLSRVMHPEKIVFKTTDWLKCGAILVVFWFIFYLIAVIFGAPLIQKTTETVHFACLLTVTAILPCCLSLGPNLINWANTFTLNSSEIGHSVTCYITCMFSLFGAWFGAFPMPLDWDRPWQIWPISCVIGNLIGYSSGNIISTIYLLYLYREHNKYKLV